MAPTQAKDSPSSDKDDEPDNNELSKDAGPDGTALTAGDSRIRGLMPNGLFSAFKMSRTRPQATSLFSNPGKDNIKESPELRPLPSTDDGPDKDAAPDGTASTAGGSRIDHITLTANALTKTRTRLYTPSIFPIAGKSQKSIELRQLPSVRHSGPPPHVPKKTIFDLHLEIHYMIIEYLSFPDILTLRLVSKTYRALTTPRNIATALGGPLALRAFLQRHCHLCLSTNCHLLPPSGPGFPLNRVCVPCAMAAGDKRLRVGQRVNLGAGEEDWGGRMDAWVCRWCGWPVVGAQGDFHERCWRVFERMTWVWMVGASLQLVLGAVGLSLTADVLGGLVRAGPAVSLVLMALCAFLLRRGGIESRFRYTYFVLLGYELAVLGCWVPPVWCISTVVAGRPPGEVVPKMTVAALVIFCFILFFHFVNALGYIAIISGYDIAVRKRPHASTTRKMMYPFMVFLITCAFPMSVGNAGLRVDEAAPFTFGRDRDEEV